MHEFTFQHRGGGGPPMVCLHGFTDTWRTWELVLPALERRHEVLAPTLAGHRGGPPLPVAGEAALVEAIEAAMDAAGIATAHLAGNSLGGYLAMLLAARGRARSVVALAPAGGWPADDFAARWRTARQFRLAQRMVRTAAPFATAIAATPSGRRRATETIAVNYEHIPADLVAHLILGAAGCAAADALIDHWLREGWELDVQRIDCPVRIVWGTEDRLLPWPSSAARYRGEWLPHADWVVLDGVGHSPQLDVPTETAELILGFTT